MAKWTSPNVTIEQLAIRLQSFRKAERVLPFLYLTGKVRDVDDDTEHSFPQRVQVVEISPKHDDVALAIYVNDEPIRWYVKPIKPYTFEITDTELTRDVYDIPMEEWPDWVHQVIHERDEKLAAEKEQKHLLKLANEATGMHDILHYLGFSKEVEITHAPEYLKQSQGHGIYVLHFTNKQYYVGQTRNARQRLLAHKRNHHDIKGISFKIVAKKQLDTWESHVIWLLEDKGFYLRNIDLTSILSSEPSNFDKDVMLPEDQQRWLNDISLIDISGKRDEDAKRANLYLERYNNFKEQTFSENITKVLGAYIQSAIPGIYKGEASYWAVSCLPPPPYNVAIRLNVNWQEVFLASADNNGYWFYFCISRREMQKAYGESLDGLAQKYPSLKWSITRYRAGGADQLTVEITKLATAVAFIKDDAFIRGARLYNLRLMKKGRCPWRNSHSFFLVDEIAKSFAAR
ncbi:MAG: hypothetical protein RLZZ387_3407 [Chloroflexota bacterium]|jgi:hypothetical protein